ncbi:MAG: hypothetical protein L6R39_002711 [Caloplaca ligustica]|nr:MAG: hypothetical protein L6R39_002711 [Caloplaca ligustica]
MHAFLLTPIISLLTAQSFVNAEDVHIAKRQSPPNPGVPEDFASFANVPLWPYQSFVTEPDFHPPVLQISKQPSATDGLLVFGPLPFLPVYPDRFAGGLIMDQLGHAIWHSAPGALGNLEVQRLPGDNVSVLKYWTGGIGGNFIDAHGFGSVTVLSTACNNALNGPITLNDGTFKSGDSMQNKPQPSYIDIHENLITDRGTILVTAYNSTPFDLSSVGGPKDGWVLDSLIYEIDLKTNKTLFRWSSIEHVDALPLNASHQLNPDGSIIGGLNATHPWDYFLTNAVEPVSDGYLLSVRHYWSVVKIDAKGGVSWTLNGKTGGDFKLVDQATKPSTFSWQHDVRSVDEHRNKDIIISMFNNNNGGLDNGTAPSTGLTLYLDLQKRTARTISALQDPKDPIYALSQGTFQSLAKKHSFVAYGQIPKFKEFDQKGNVVMDARFGNDNQVSSYRSFLIANNAWSATPYWDPKIAATRLQNGTMVLSMSWNGATPDVYDSWRIYESVGPSATNTSAPYSQAVRRTGFESNATLAESTKFVFVEAAKGKLPVRRSSSLAL